MFVCLINLLFLHVTSHVEHCFRETTGVGTRTPRGKLWSMYDSHPCVRLPWASILVSAQKLGILQQISCTQIVFLYLVNSLPNPNPRRALWQKVVFELQAVLFSNDFPHSCANIGQHSQHHSKRMVINTSRGRGAWRSKIMRRPSWYKARKWGSMQWAAIFKKATTSDRKLDNRKPRSRSFILCNSVALILRDVDAGMAEVVRA